MAALRDDWQPSIQFKTDALDETTRLEASREWLNDGMGMLTSNFSVISKRSHTKTALTLDRF